MQIAQCLVVHRARRLGHDIRSALGFREGNDFANRLRAGHQHDQAIQAESQTAVRRRTELQRIEQEAELLFLLGLVDAENAEYRLLHFLAMDADGAATQLGTVEHHVVCTRQRSAGVGLQLLRCALRRRERVVQCAQRAVIVLFEHREVDHPQRRPVAGQQLEVMAELDAQRAQRLGDDLGLVGTKEDDIAIDRADAIEDDIEVVFRDELDDRRLQTLDALGALVDLDIGQALGAVDADELGVVVDLAARHACGTRHTKGGHATFRIVGRAGEHLELDRIELIGNVHQLERDAQVRLVRAIATHGLFERHVREFANLQIQHFLEQLADHPFGDTDDVRLVEEAGLDIDLGEFGLTISSQVFVAETLGDLIVAIEAGHHEQLLEQLRRLRQGKEIAGMGATRHQIVTRTLRRRTAKDRRFDMEEAVLVEVATDAGGDARAQLQLLGHLRATQVDEAVAQASFFTDIAVLVERERRSLRIVEHLQLVTQHLDGAGRDVRIHRTGRTQAHLAGHLDHVLAAYAVGRREGFRAVGIENHLGQPLAIANVEEDHPSMVTTAMYPAAKSDFLTVQAFVQLAAIVTAHHGGVRFSYLEFDGAPELGPANGAVTALRKRLYRMRYRLGRQALQHMLMLPGTSAG